MLDSVSEGLPAILFFFTSGKHIAETETDERDTEQPSVVQLAAHFYRTGFIWSMTVSHP